MTISAATVLSGSSEPDAAASSAPPIEQTPSAPAAEQPAPEQQAWYGDLGDEALTDWAKNKNFTSAAHAMRAYQNLEKFLGADKAGRGVVVPKEDSPSEEWAAFYDKIGRPQTPEAYELPVPDGTSPEFANTMAQIMHESGIPKPAAQSLAKAWNEYTESFQQQQNEAKEMEVLQQDAALKREWGAAYNSNIAEANIAVRQFGIEGDTIEALQDAMGYEKTIKFFYDLRQKIGDDKFISGQTPNDPSRSAYSPAEAERTWQSLLNDKDFVNKVMAGDPKALAIKSNLAKYRPSN